MTNEPLSNKVLVLGLDGMDPKITRRFIEEGLMPNTKKLIEAGSRREDLHMLGGVPTVTPPMWTTLATGANPATHGITDFWNQDWQRLDRMVYGLDSRICQAEQLWNVTAEAGKKTLVWHWPGSAWPPSSDSENLFVVDGTNPVGVNMGTAQREWEKFIIADAATTGVSKTDHVEAENGAGCIINNVDELLEANDAGTKDNANNLLGDAATGELVVDDTNSELYNLANQAPDIYSVGITPAEGWAFAIPEGAKEFDIIIADGLVRRPTLILKNEQGVYDTLQIFKNKKTPEPLYTMINDGEVHENFIDEIVNDNGDRFMCSRSIKVYAMKEDGSYLKMYMSAALDINDDGVFSPKSMYQDIVTNIGYVPAVSLISGTDTELEEMACLPVWDKHCKWQADCINYMIEEQGIEVVFSHLHEIDCNGHQFLQYCNPNEEIDKYNTGFEYTKYRELWREVYRIADRYIGEFLHLLDEDWTIVLCSDHGLISMDHVPPLICEMAGCAIPIMKELGYVTLKTDEEGNEIPEIDWTKTTAVNNRSNHIILNLKGRTPYGIVDPADQYALERKIIDDLYSYRHPVTGERIISIAMRNKDAALLGMDGPESGDIIFFLDEGYNKIHADSLSTYEGQWGTTVAPIITFTGKGIKEDYITTRVIREVDIAPTVAALLGVRMPAQCEGAPVYQVLEGAC